MTTAAPSTVLATIQPVFTDAERVALAGFLAGYRGLTREAYALDLRQFSNWCRARSLALFAVRRADIEAFAGELEVTGRARATVTRRLSTIAGFYKYAVEEELLDRSPAAHVRRPRVDYESHAVALDRSELGALLVAAGLGTPRDHALISLLALNGLRVSEATGAGIEHLGLERGHRTLTVTRKGGKVVTVPLAPRTARAIDLAIGERTAEPVSPQDGGTVKAGGVVLAVPAGVVAHDTTATIVAMAPGIYDLSINSSWHGEVRVTVPLRSPDDVVLHQIGGYWMPETAPGVATAAVSHLSPFTTLLTKGLSALCIRNTVAKVLTCLAEKGVKHIDKSLAGWLASKLSTSCAAALFADAYGVVDVLWGALSEPACTGHAGESGYTPAPRSSSSSHGTGTQPASPRSGSTPGQGNSPPSSGSSTSAPAPPSTPPPAPVPVNAYDNYGPANAGRAMCRGNPGRPESMPGGTASQSFTVPNGVASLSSALVQIDPDSTVSAHLTIYVNGNLAGSADAAAAGDTHFSFGPAGVQAGDTVTIAISFTASSGKIITVYTAGSPGGTFTASNHCSDGAPNVSSTATGLRAVISGMS